MKATHAGIAVGGALFAGGVVAPALMNRLSGKQDLPARRFESSSPSIEVVVPAYLEVSEIASKVADLRSALAEYQGMSRITVMASDAATAEAARRAQADSVIECGRRGKPAAMNQAAIASRSDILVFTDANCRIVPSEWPARAVKLLETYGVVSAQKRETGGLEAGYWRLENLIRSDGLIARPTLGVVGEFMALRRIDYVPLDENTLLDDFLLAWSVTRVHGLLSTVHPGIQTVEEAAGGDDQWIRRVRIAEGVLTTVAPRLRGLVRTRVGREIALHKLYRMTIGAAGFWIMGLCAAITSVPAAAAVVASVIASIAHYRQKIRIPGPFGTVATVVAMQAVPVSAWFRLARRRSGPPAGGWVKVAR